MDVAKSISQGLAQRIVIAKASKITITWILSYITQVNGELFDLLRPFEGDATLELLDFENAEGRAVFWHSSAHVLGEACERHYGCHLCIGPPTDDGFYYEMSMEE